MTDKISKYLNAEQQATVLEAVRQAEAGTSGEIVPMLVARSGDYREAAVQAAIIIASILSLIVSLAVNDTSVWFFIPLTSIIYFPCLALMRHSTSLKIAFTPAARILDVVRQRAIYAFHEKGLHRTREENGILVFISLQEQKVWILGDRGINAAIPPEQWIALASGLAAGISKGHLAETLVTTITAIGAILAKHFPRHENDINELPDLLVE